MATYIGQVYTAVDGIKLVTTAKDRILIENTKRYFRKLDQDLNDHDEQNPSIGKNIRGVVEELALNINKESEVKRLVIAMGEIADEEKVDYLANLLYCLMTEKIDHETYVKVFDTITSLGIYEIRTGIKLYLGEQINYDLGFYYAGQLMNVGFVRNTWGALSGPSLDPNEHKLTDLGKEAFQCITKDFKSTNQN
nr:MAG TPA: hypothetical protein [Caudoviricetes sp.]